MPTSVFIVPSCSLESMSSPPPTYSSNIWYKANLPISNLTVRVNFNDASNNPILVENAKLWISPSRGSTPRIISITDSVSYIDIVWSLTMISESIDIILFITLYDNDNYLSWPTPLSIMLYPSS